MSILTQGVEEGEDVTITNITNDWGVLVVTGPKSRDALAGLTDTDLGNDSFKWLTGKEIQVAGVNVRALRVSYVGELGWELHCRMEDMVQLYNAVWEAGQAHNMKHFGTYAMNSLRMEKAYKGWGAELTNEITMVEADVMRFFRADKEEDFKGKEATLAVDENNIALKLVYFEVEMGDNDVVGGEAVLDGDRPIGVTTSGGYGHYTGKSLGFAYVEPQYATPGSTFDVELIAEPRKATVIADPVWDPQSEKPRA